MFATLCCEVLQESSRYPISLKKNHKNKTRTELDDHRLNLKGCFVGLIFYGVVLIVDCMSLGRSLEVVGISYGSIRFKGGE